jgi:hypothetical protein
MIRAKRHIWPSPPAPHSRLEPARDSTATTRCVTRRLFGRIYGRGRCARKREADGEKRAPAMDALANRLSAARRRRRRGGVQGPSTVVRPERVGVRRARASVAAVTGGT